MDMEFDRLTWCKRSPRSGNASLRSRPDWEGLKARLLAARDARRILTPGIEAGESTVSGSFARPAARWIIEFASGSAFVNPKDSANRKAGGVNEDLVVNAITSGDRG